MSAHASRGSVDTADGIVANAVGSAFTSVKQGASELQTRFSEGLPATSHFLSRVVYKTSYAVSFGVTFPVMMIVRIVPKDNVLVHGLVDGALAARDRVHEWGGDVAEDDMHDSDVETMRGADNGTAHHDDSADHATHRRPKAKRGATRKTTRSTSRKKS
jgi:hypothetical protein